MRRRFVSGDLTRGVLSMSVQRLTKNPVTFNLKFIRHFRYSGVGESGKSALFWRNSHASGGYATRVACDQLYESDGDSF